MILSFWKEPIPTKPCWVSVCVQTDSWIDRLCSHTVNQWVMTPFIHSPLNACFRKPYIRRHYFNRSFSCLGDELLLPIAAQRWCNTQSIGSYRSGRMIMSVHYFTPEWNILTFGCIGMKFGADIYGPQRINPTDFGYPLSFTLVPPWDWHL